MTSTCALRPHAVIGTSVARRLGRAAAAPVRASLGTNASHLATPARRDDAAPSVFGPLKGLASGLLAAAMAFGIAAESSPALAFPQVYLAMTTG